MYTKIKYNYMLIIIFLKYLILIFLLDYIFLYFALNIHSKLIDIIINIFHKVWSISFAFIENGEFFIIFLFLDILLNEFLILLCLLQITLSNKPLLLFKFPIFLFLLLFSQPFLHHNFLSLPSLGRPFNLLEVFGICCL